MTRFRPLPVLALAVSLAGSACIQQSSGHGSPTGTPTPTPTGTTTPNPTPTPGTNLVRLSPPSSGTPVFVDDSNGLLVATVVSGTNGEAMIDLPPGGSVTALFGSLGPNQYAATTIVDPPAGVVLELPGQLPQTSTPTPTPTPPASTLSLTITNVPPTAASVDWAADCYGDSQSSPGSTISVSPSLYECEGWTDWGVFATARDANGLAIAWGETTGVPFDPGNVVPITVDLSHTDFDYVDLTHGPLPAVGSVLYDVDGNTTADMLPVHSTASATRPASTAPETITVAAPHGAVSQWFAGVSVTIDHLAGDSWYAAAEWTPPPGTVDPSYELDPESFPEIQVGAVDDADPQHVALQWIGTDAPFGDAGFAVVGWQSTTGRSGDWQWTLPPGRTSVRIPELPAAYSAYLPDASSTFRYRSAGLIEVDVLIGYSEYLSHDFSVVVPMHWESVMDAVSQ